MQQANEALTRVGSMLYDEMLEGFNFSAVLRTMTRMDESLSSAAAEELLHAYLQWVSIIPAVGQGKCAAMLDSPVETACHAFVLNTKLYQEFCEKYLGFFLHHEPFDGETTADSDSLAHSTLSLLESQYGERLSPVFRQWRSEVDSATYRLACCGWCR